ISITGLFRCVVPALFTTTCTLPKSSIAASKSVCQSACLVTSPGTAIALPPLTAISLATRSAAAPLRSFTTTFAPSRANVFAIPSPNPDPPPVTIAVLPCSLMSSPILAMLDGDGLKHRESIQRFEAFFAAVARMFDAAERQFNAAARTIIVDEHLPRTYLAGNAHLPAAIACPDAGDQPEVRAVGKLQRVGFVIEGHGAKDWAEHFFTCQTMRRRDIA